MKKQINKIILLVLATSLFINTSVNVTEAFLDWDLGLNLYQELDKGLADFEEKQYVYELSAQNKKDISENINRILREEKIWDCLKDWATPEIVESVANWNIEILTKNLKDECYDSEKKEFQSKKMWDIISKLWNIRDYYQNVSVQKAKSIHEISRIWMYSDWNTDNSPFDIIKDLQDIDKIIFTEEIEYIWEEYDFLSDYKDDPYISPFFNTMDDILPNDDEEDDNQNYNNTSEIIESWLIENDENQDWNTNTWDVPTPDWNNYICPPETNWSWLDQDSLDALTETLNSDNTDDNFDFWNWWHVALPWSNIIDIPNLDSPTYAYDMLMQGVVPYSPVNDNSQWWCNQFFCITIEFVIQKQNALDYADSHSIENILETSNKHLKKAANTSLVQSKMTTNNFELSLRDLDLPNMFHMWFIITSKAPPILNLENITKNSQELSQAEENSKDKENNIIKTLLSNKYKNFNLDYSDANNLNNFNKLEKYLKWIVSSLENPSKRAQNLKNEYNKVQNLKNQINSYEEAKLSQEINNDILNDFDKEFSELEQFNLNILDYVTNIDILIKNLKEIKTYSW